MNSLFALSLFPYLVFLFFLSRLRRIPRLALTGFWLLLLFVAISIPAGLYAQVHYGTSLANVDPLHGGQRLFSPSPTFWWPWASSKPLTARDPQRLGTAALSCSHCKRA